MSALTPGTGTAAGTTTGTSTTASAGTAVRTSPRALVRAYHHVAADALVRLALEDAARSTAEDDSALFDDDGPGPDELPEAWWDDEDVDPAAEGAPSGDGNQGSGAASAAFSLFPSGDGIGWAVRPVDLPGDDPILALAAARRLHRLERLASAMARHQPEVVRATTLPDAYLALRRVTFTELADEIGSPSQSSRDADLLVRLPCGLVPLTFFRWRRADNERAERIALELYPALADVWARQGQVTAEDRFRVRDRVARRLGESPDTVRKHLPAVLAAVEHPDVVRTWQTRFPFAEPVDLREALGVGKGGETAMQLALVRLMGPPMNALDEKEER